MLEFSNAAVVEGVYLVPELLNPALQPNVVVGYVFVGVFDALQ